MTSISITITAEQARQRADKVLLAHPELQRYARAAIQKLFTDELVTINGEPIKSGHKVKLNDVLLATTTPLLAEPDAIELPIIYEDDDVIVINKPAGVLTHTNGAYNREASVASFIRSRVNQSMSGERGGIVHRLDRRTSGVLICAKHQDSLSWLQKQFSQRKTKKSYVAIVEGTVTPPEAIIDAPIARNAAKPKTFHVDPAGKSAQTVYHVLASHAHHTCLLLEPVTGRTHQLRVHLQYIHHPILGDDLYNPAGQGNLLLHALKLEITLPNKERKIFQAPLPTYFPEFAREAVA